MGLLGGIFDETTEFGQGLGSNGVIGPGLHEEAEMPGGVFQIAEVAVINSGQVEADRACGPVGGWEEFEKFFVMTGGGAEIPVPKGSFRLDSESGGAGTT